jgi:hypothetical protein
MASTSSLLSAVARVVASGTKRQSTSSTIAGPWFFAFAGQDV